MSAWGASGQEIAELSSILKALKKLEDEYPRAADAGASLPRTPGVKKTLRRWEINSGRFAPVLWAALTVVVLAAGAWFLIYMRSPDKPPAPVAGLPSSPLPSASLHQRPIGSTSAPQTAGIRKSGTGLADKRRPRALGSETKARAVPTAAARTQKGEKQRKPALPLPVNQAEGQTGAEMPILEADLELQAVSWDPSPANRIAVINGSIMREGAAMEGFTIVRIDPDEVIVRKGLSQWRLLFNLKK